MRKQRRRSAVQKRKIRKSMFVGPNHNLLAQFICFKIHIDGGGGVGGMHYLIFQMFSLSSRKFTNFLSNIPEFTFTLTPPPSGDFRLLIQQTTTLHVHPYAKTTAYWPHNLRRFHGTAYFANMMQTPSPRAGGAVVIQMTSTLLQRTKLNASTCTHLKYLTEKARGRSTQKHMGYQEITNLTKNNQHSRNQSSG